MRGPHLSRGASTLSFFDDADAPRRAQPGRARRASGGSTRQPRPNRAARRPPGGSGTDPDVRRRQLILAGALLLGLIVLVFGVRACQDSARKDAVREYTTNISNIVRDSDAEVGRPLFELLSGADDRGRDIQNQANNLRADAQEDLQRAEELDVPGEVEEAQRFALLTLELRRDGVQRIADDLQPAVRGPNGAQAVRAIAGQMRAFDASDVIWSQRAVPLLRTALADDDLDPRANPIARSTFLRDSAWLDPTFVADRLGAAAGAGDTGGAATPGTHGHGLTSVSVGDTTLVAGAVNRVPASPPPVFNVSFQNQGENDERSVRVRVELDGTGRPVTATRTVPVTTAGQSAEASVTLSRAPAVTGSVVEVTVEVVPVPGEETTDNNRETYQILFTE